MSDYHKLEKNLNILISWRDKKLIKSKVNAIFMGLTGSMNLIQIPVGLSPANLIII